MELHTARLVLNTLEPQSAAICVAYVTRNREFHAPYSPPYPEDYFTPEHWAARLSEAEERFKEKQGLSLFVFLKDSQDHIMGKINFSNFVYGAFHACYLGYDLDKDHTGKGYMTEALAAAISYLFANHDVHRIMANYMPANERSANVLRRLGFRVEGYARDYLFLNGAWRDHILTAIHTDEWSRRNTVPQ
jgi:ribosomal-protein-alanine N-acetyltransferase